MRYGRFFRPHTALDAYRADIDGIRAVAILLVLGYHAFPDRVRGGFIGVDIFFVISGFLISSVLFKRLNTGELNLLDFYARRIKRLFPSLLSVLAACLIFGWYSLFPEEYAHLGKHALGGAMYISNFVLWGEAEYFDAVSENKPLLHLWSLGVEEQFYFVLPIILWLGRGHNLIILGLIVIFAASSYFCGDRLFAVDRAGAFYLPVSRFWELMMGVALAYCEFRRNPFLRSPLPTARPAEWRHLASVAGMAILILAAVHVSRHTPFTMAYALLPTLGTCLLIWAGPTGVINRWVLSLPPVIGLGLISYPLYLWHWPLFSFAYIVESGVPSFGVRISLIFFAIFLAWLSYAYLERPARFGVRSQYFPLWLLVSLFVIGAVGYWIMIQNGFPHRTITKEYIDNRNELVRTPARDEACLSYIGKKLPKFDYCRRHDIGARETIAMIGDSHAHAAFFGMAQMLGEKGFNSVMLANSSCPPFPGGEHGATQAYRADCSERTQQLLDVLLALPDIGHVIIVTRGPVYLTGKEFGIEQVNPALQIEPEQFSSSLQNLVHLLIRAGKQVSYVTENPEMPFLPSRCIQRPFRVTTSECTIPLQTVLERQAEYLAILNNIHGMHIVSVLDVFCTNGICHFASNDGALLYADKDHLSTAGSIFQANALRGALLP